MNKSAKMRHLLKHRVSNQLKITWKRFVAECIIKMLVNSMAHTHADTCNSIWMHLVAVVEFICAP